MLSFGAVYSALQGGLNFEFADEILKCDANKGYWSMVSYIECNAKFFIFTFRFLVKINKQTNKQTNK